MIMAVHGPNLVYSMTRVHTIYHITLHRNKTVIILVN
jgi:hypothetical protein